MSTEQVTSTPVVRPAKHAAIHPLSPITASEITQAATFIKNLYPSHIELGFKAITLQEPEKAQLAPYLDAEHHGQPTGHIDRKAFINYIIKNTVCVPCKFCFRRT
jgi:primary-amine oxidase